LSPREASASLAKSGAEAPRRPARTNEACQRDPACNARPRARRGVICVSCFLQGHAPRRVESIPAALGIRRSPPAHCPMVDLRGDGVSNPLGLAGYICRLDSCYETRTRHTDPPIRCAGRGVRRSDLWSSYGRFRCSWGTAHFLVASCLALWSFFCFILFLLGTLDSRLVAIFFDKLGAYILLFGLFFALISLGGEIYGPSRSEQRHRAKSQWPI
jgi:hypothetical protein